MYLGRSIFNFLGYLYVMGLFTLFSLLRLLLCCERSCVCMLSLAFVRSLCRFLIGIVP